MDLPLKDYVYSQLRERILYGHLHPHTCLLESGVSREFSVSRTPARLALQRLEKEGLIARNRSGPGWTVQIVRLEEILEIMELRTSLIDLMGKHALEKITPEEIDGLWERMGRIDSLVSDRDFRGFQQIHHRQADEYLKCCLEVYRRIQRGSGKF